MNNNESVIVDKEELDEEQIFIEQIILGLRMMKGIEEKKVLLDIC